MYIYGRECVNICPKSHSNYRINGIGDKECVDTCDYYQPDGAAFKCTGSCSDEAPYINVITSNKTDRKYCELKCMSGYYDSNNKCID